MLLVTTCLGRPRFGAENPRVERCFDPEQLGTHDVHLVSTGTINIVSISSCSSRVGANDKSMPHTTRGCATYARL